MNTFHPIRLSLLVQFVVTTVASLIALLQGQVQAWSLILGAVVFIVPNLYFTHYAFRYRGAEISDWIQRSFMWGQTGKLALAATGFALVFKFVDPISTFWLFSGYVLMIFTQWWLGHKIATIAAA